MDSLSGPVAGTPDGRWLRSTPGEKPPKRIRDDADTGFEIVLSNGGLRFCAASTARPCAAWPTPSSGRAEPAREHSRPEESQEELGPLSGVAATSVQGRVALGERTSRAVLRVGSGPARGVARLPGEPCAEVVGFSLHANVRIRRSDRDRLERLRRYVACPALPTERLSLSKQGNVLLRLRRPWRDKTTSLVFEPLTFIERLAALIPRPRSHLVTHHGVLAPASS